MTLPKTGSAEWAGPQSAPWAIVNEMARGLDAAFAAAIIVDRDLAAPPGTCADGANYLIAASPTGLWSGQAGRMATALGANASNGWKFSTIAVEGFLIYLQDENATLQYDGAAWLPFPAPKVTTQSGTTYTLGVADSNSTILFSNSGSIVLTVPQNSDAAIPIGSFIELILTGSGTLTVVEGTGASVDSRGDLVAAAGQYAVLGLRKISTNGFILTGDLA